jgi:signal transduction histidine kinase
MNAESWPRRLPRVRHWPGARALRPPAADAAVAFGLVCAFSEPGFDPYHHDSGAAWAVGGVIAAAALAWRRSRPAGVWLIATMISTWLLVTRHGDDWGGLSPLVLLPSPLLALYTVAGYGTRKQGQLALLGSAAALLTALLARSVRPESVATTAALLVTAWALGESMRSHRAGVAALRDRAAALESERAERDRRAASDERSRIARDMHDIVAHHVGVMTLQAGTARMLAQSGQPPGTELLTGIETAGRQAMTELREALGVIRRTPDGSRPQPGLAELPELARRMRGSGLDVTVTGSAGLLPGAADVAAYRIVQEGLTNVLRHSAARSARVVLARTPDGAEVRVQDGGPARDPGPVAAPGRAPDGRGGYGLIGLRERVAPFGGSLGAGSVPGGGFELHAVLPAGDGIGLPSPLAASIPVAGAATAVPPTSGPLVRPGP